MDRPRERHPGSAALRKGRVSVPGGIYLVTTATLDRRPIFRDFAAARGVSKALDESRLWPDAKLLAWVLMPDHLHMMIQLGRRESLASIMRIVKTVTACRVRGVPGIEPPIWQRGYHDHAMRKGRDVKSAARYLIANPVRAGLVDDVRQYPFWNAIWLDPSSEN